MNKKNYEFIENVAGCVFVCCHFSKDVCDWIACQFALESDFGGSSLAITNKNFCGMKNPMVRISTALHAGDSNYHWAQYTGFITCVIDYLLCLQYHKPISTNYDNIKHFSTFISKFYCPEPDYIDKINLIYSQFKSYQDEQKC